MAINTRGAGQMYLNAMLTLWEQRKREEEQARQEQAAMERQRQQQEYQTGRDASLNTMDVNEQMRREGVQAAERSRTETAARKKNLRGTLDTLGQQTTDTLVGTQGRRNEDAVYRQLMGEQGIQYPQNLPPGQAKTYYDETLGRRDFDAIHPTESTQAPLGGDTYQLESQLQDEIMRISSQFNGENREAVVNALVGIGDAESNPYGASLLSRIKEMSPAKFTEIRDYILQVVGTVGKQRQQQQGQPAASPPINQPPSPLMPSVLQRPQRPRILDKVNTLANQQLGNAVNPIIDRLK